jgi:hypothetical protein
VSRCLAGVLLACTPLATACSASIGPGLDGQAECAVDETLYAAASTRDGWLHPTPVMRFAFPDPAISELMRYGLISDVAGIPAANASIFIVHTDFERAYQCLRIVGVAAIPADAAQRPQIRVDYVYYGQRRQAYAYGTTPEACPSGRNAVLIIAGWDNQSSAIVSQDPSDYHFGILDALEDVVWRYVLIKPNEDVLTWHDGAQRKLVGRSSGTCA